MPLEQVEQEALSAKRNYIPIMQPITASFPELGGTVVVNIGLAVRGDTEKALIKVLEEDPSSIIAHLGNVVLETGGTMTAEAPPETLTADIWQALRAALPAAFLADLNKRVADLDDTAPILEVLIMNFRLSI